MAVFASYSAHRALFGFHWLYVPQLSYGCILLHAKTKQADSCESACGACIFIGSSGVNQQWYVFRQLIGHVCQNVALQGAQQRGLAAHAHQQSLGVVSRGEIQN